MILYKFPFGPLETNTVLVACEKTKKAAVIDPAYHSTNMMLEYASTHELLIEKILLTHSHWDHFADAYLLKQKTGAALYVHPLDVKNLDHPGSDGIPLFVPVQPVQYDHLVNDGDTVEIGLLSFQVIHTPGHSPGSVCYYSRTSRVLISGDSLFQGSIGNLRLPTSDPVLMWPSLRKLAMLPPETRVIPGHGEDTTIGEESWLGRAEEIFR
jgi:glyoxylase-like metal-dependent hydrolase (beta-lactamase superfamily II)